MFKSDGKTFQKGVSEEFKRTISPTAEEVLRENDALNARDRELNARERNIRVRDEEMVANQRREGELVANQREGIAVANEEDGGGDVEEADEGAGVGTLRRLVGETSRSPVEGLAL